MKILKNVLVYVALSIVTIVSLVFAFVELRALFAGDHLLFNNAFIGGLAYLMRGLYYLFIIALCVFIVIFRIKHQKINLVLWLTSLSIFIGAFMTLAFYDYYISLVIIFVTSLPLLITSLGFFLKKEKD